MKVTSAKIGAGSGDAPIGGGSSNEQDYGTRKVAVNEELILL